MSASIICLDGQGDYDIQRLFAVEALKLPTSHRATGIHTRSASGDHYIRRGQGPNEIQRQSAAAEQYSPPTK